MGASKKKIVTGYRYHLGMHLVLCAGTADAITRIDCGERTAWTGSVTSNSTITIDAEELWGGEKREGGVSGSVAFAFGANTQAVDSYLAAQLGSPTPAWRGVTALVCQQVYIGTNPYVKPWEIEVKRIPSKTFNATKADIGGNANPANMIYELITNADWGLGLPSSLIDSTTFTAAANTLYTEGLGLSMIWSQQEPVANFIQQILDHIAAVLYVDPASGRFKLKLIRYDYSLPSTLLLDESNVLRLESFSRRAIDETVNEIVVVYHDRTTYKDVSITAQDLANIQAQGAIVSETRNYSGIPTSALAARLAERDLIAASATIAKVRLTANREAYSLRPGDVFRLTWPPKGISEMVFRVGEVSGGTLADGAITIIAAQDVFGLPASSYLGIQAAGWADPVALPAACPYEQLIEAPYWDVARNLSAADLDYLDAGVGFVEALGVRPSGSSYGYTLWTRLGSAAYVASGFSPHVPTATVSAAVTISQTSITLAAGVDLSLVTTGSYAYLGPEVVKIVTINPSTGDCTIRRGILDTVPQTHASGTRVWFADAYQGIDEIEYTTGEVVRGKLVTLTGRGELAIGSATERTVTMAGRFDRPYLPGKVTINGSSYPVSVSGDLTIAWAHRDRTQQTAYLVEQSEASIGPEAGTTYTLRVYGPTGTLKRTYSGLTGTSQAYTNAQEVTDFGAVQSALRFELESYRDGLRSYQVHSFWAWRTLTMAPAGLEVTTAADTVTML